MNRALRVTQGPLARLLAPADSGLRRIALELAGEQVVFVARDGAVQALCTCGAAHCAHLAQALALLEVETDAIGLRDPTPAARARSSARPPPMPRPEVDGLADLIDELVLATARAGVSHADSVSVKLAIDQLMARVGTPVPLGMARFMGRFQEAMLHGEVGRVGRLLDGLANFGAVLRSGLGTPHGGQLRRAWLSQGEGAPDAISDAVLIEVAREWLHGLTRQSIERRYLVDVNSSAIYCEERGRGDNDVSVGPCPRVVHVAYGEVDPATRPQRVRLLQYSIEAEPSVAQWTELAALGAHRFADLLVRYSRALADAPALAEPFALVVPTAIENEQGGVLRDVTGARLEICDDGGSPVLDTVQTLAMGGEVSWIAGRLRGTARGITLRPTSMLVRTDHGFSLRRLT